MALAATAPFTAFGQNNSKTDTLECHIIGFSAGIVAPSNALSFETHPDGTHSKNATMSSLYKSPYLDFGINANYKYKSNWIVNLDGNMWFGNDNLKERINRMGDVFTRDSIVVGTGGTDATVTCYNRGISSKGGIGKIFPMSPKNPNSGIMARISGGMMFQQTIFMLNMENAPQLDGDYANLYDHQRLGWMLSEGIGYWFMSNRESMANFYVGFEISQCWSRSTRDYMIDYHLGLCGKDNNRYFDLMYSLKICWMFPLTGKSSQDYYFY